MENYRYELKASAQIQRVSYVSNQLGAAGKVCCSVYTDGGTLFVGTDKGILFLSGERFVKISGYDDEVRALAAYGETVYACTKSGTFVIRDFVIKSFIQLESDVCDAVCTADGDLILLASDALYKLCGDGFVLQDEIGLKSACSLAVTPAGEIFAVCRDAVIKRFGKRRRWANIMRHIADIPEDDFTFITSDPAGVLWVGTEAGVYVFDGKSEWLAPDDFSFFPKCRINCIAFGKNGETVIGTPVGVYVAGGERTRFFGRGRYLNGDNVFCVSIDPLTGDLWVGTDGGIVRLYEKLMTLEEKEAYYSSLMDSFKRENYVTGRELTENGRLDTGRVSITDNDGLWTAVYVISQCLKYGATGDRQALENARASFYALVKLIRISGIKGFPARAIRRPGENGYGDGDPEWHPGKDEKGELEWKGETSSDELTGHFLALSWYFDLCADESEKKLAAGCAAEMTDHLLTHGYTLCDTDGKPTTWAHFGPYELNDDDSWCWEKGINSLELLTFLRITYNLTGDEKYITEQKRLAWDEHYAMNILLYKKDDAHSCHIDDRLGFYTLTCLMRLETDETLLRYARFALRRHYEYEKKEHNPFFDFIYASALGCHTDISEAVRSLEDYPLDLRRYKIRNSIRPDIVTDPRTGDFGENAHALDAIPVGERVTDIFSANAFALDSHGSDGSITAPTAWLVSYWYGRYYGII